jgi:hypothetical protein
VQCDGERFSEIYIAQTHALCMNANLLRRRWSSVLSYQQQAYNKYRT